MKMIPAASVLSPVVEERPDPEQALMRLWIFGGEQLGNQEMVSAGILRAWLEGAPGSGERPPLSRVAVVHRSRPGTADDAADQVARAQGMMVLDNAKIDTNRDVVLFFPSECVALTCGFAPRLTEDSRAAASRFEAAGIRVIRIGDKPANAV